MNAKNELTARIAMAREYNKPTILRLTFSQVLRRKASKASTIPDEI
jgi:hypothetical protein